MDIFPRARRSSDWMMAVLEVLRNRQFQKADDSSDPVRKTTTTPHHVPSTHSQLRSSGLLTWKHNFSNARHKHKEQEQAAGTHSLVTCCIQEEA